MFRGKHRKRALTLVGALLFGAGIVGTAFAYWSSTGSGAGSAQTTTSSPITVVQTATPTGLYPGGSVALSGDFNNPNAGNVFVGSVTASVTPFTAQANPGKPACTQADFTITGTATVNAQIPAGNGVGAWSGLSLNMTNAGTNQDNCQNITVPITYASA
jgi:hypothetical protein